MEPVLSDGQVVISLRRKYYAPGDVVLFNHHGYMKVKRIQAYDAARRELVVLGDNPNESTDSRDFGPVSVACVRGRVVWPRT